MAAIWIIGPACSAATEYPTRYEVVRDTKGRRIGTMECDGITSECVIRDTRGRRTGTVDQEPIEQEPQEPTLEEILDEARQREPGSG